MDAVTGAAGFVGAEVVRQLVASGRPVRAVVRRRGSCPVRVDGVSEAIADVRDADALARAFDGAERVFHCAAKISITGDPDGAVRAINVDGARNVGRAIAGRRLVHVSSVSAFTVRGAVAIDESSPPAGPDAAAYDRTKRESEDALRANAVIVNPTGILGPDDTGPSLLGALIAGLARGEVPALVDGGFDWVDVRDVAAGAIAAADRGVVGENYLLGGTFSTVRALAELVHAAGGRPPPRRDVPRWLASAVAPAAQWLQVRLGQVPQLTPESLVTLGTTLRSVSHAKAARELGYAPRPLAETVADTVRWFLTPPEAR